MTKENAIQIFEQQKVRSKWDSEAEKWYISVVDVRKMLKRHSKRFYKKGASGGKICNL